MEAGFLTSSSFTKNGEVNPTIRAGTPIYTNTKKHSHLAQCRKVAFPFHTKRCQLSSSSPGDDEKPYSTTDRRSPRVHATGQQSTPEDPAENVETPSPSPVPAGDKEARVINEPGKGCLLIASEKLDGHDFFERAVVLLLHTEESGPIGVILNRPPVMSMKRAGLADNGPISNSPLFIGGPVGGLCWALASPKEGSEDELGKRGVFEEVSRGLYFGPKENLSIDALTILDGVGDIRFFDGYCGWEKKQLLEEIEVGFWTVASCSPSVIGLGNVGNVGLWEEVLGLVGLAKVG